MSVDLGRTCVCGRKVVALSAVDETVTLVDVPVTPPRLPGIARRADRTATCDAIIAGADVALRRGAMAIRAARRLRREVRETLAARARRV